MTKSPITKSWQIAGLPVPPKHIFHWLWCNTNCVIWFLSYRIHNGVSAVVADGLGPIWRQHICSHYDVLGRSERFRCLQHHDDVIQWKHFPRYWSFVRGIHRPRWIPRTKASDAELWCFLRPNKRLSKQSWGWWFETLSPPLWRHFNDDVLGRSVRFMCLQHDGTYIFIVQLSSQSIK